MSCQWFDLFVNPRLLPHASLATCENPQLRKYALELVVYKVSQPTPASTSDPSSPKSPLETIFQFCRRLNVDVEDENGIKALAVLVRNTVEWFLGVGELLIDSPFFAASAINQWEWFSWACPVVVIVDCR